MSTLRIPQLALVALIGPSGAGKSSFARKHFLATEIISSDTCRGFVSDDENDQSATADAFDVLYFIAAKRLAAGRLTVIDATNVRAEDRKKLLALAAEYHVLCTAIVFDLPERICQARNAARPDRNFGPHVIRSQLQSLHRSMRGLAREGFRSVTTFDSVEAVDAAVIERERLWNDKRDDHGPFDLIGDVHGCREELVALLTRLGYAVNGTREAPEVTAPEGRRAVFLGDLVDRGPDSPGVLRLVMHMVRNGTALCVPGNHDIKLMRKLRGKDVRVSHGLAETLQQLESESDAFRKDIADFIYSLVSHYVLDDGRLVVAHAGLKQSLQGRSSGAVRDFALYGETTGETDEYGLPERFDWAREYRGPAMVVYGHTPVDEPKWVNRTLCIDTGCVFGGRLTALRYPERETVSVEALRMYYEPARPLTETPVVGSARDGSVLDIGDVLGKRVIEPRLGRSITVRGENAHAALEVMSRFAVDPRWIIYLPPTMSPPESAPAGPLLERPDEAFDYYRKEGVTRLVCEEKHMGSRAIVILCRSEEIAARRFGVTGQGIGVIYTRTGRRFFSDSDTESILLSRFDQAMQDAGLWSELNTDWIAFDAELLPWSAKAEELLRKQYAPTGTAAHAALSAGSEWLSQAASRGLDVSALAERTASRLNAASKYVDEYRKYCWRVSGADDLRLAPFHVLAHEHAVTLTQPHGWHLDIIDRLCSVAPGLFRTTGRRHVDLNDAPSVNDARAWWTSITSATSEGMVVKPEAGFVEGRRGFVQPAIKCRGGEYLRLIYGPTYTEPENLERLRQRGVGTKRVLALREFALGYEALARFVEREPLYRVHECVFGVLAMESEPVDPRL
jgi:protein phosphatase